LGLLGDFNLDYYIESPFPFATALLLIFYVLVVSILLLNLLIAMMGDTYADVQKSAKKLWFVRLILEK
jgi:transient receptor potential cation channel subfamily V protein 6